MNNLKLYISRDLMFDGYQVFAKEGEDVVTQLIVSKEPFESGTAYGPCTILTDEHAQKLLQALWDAGLRPNNGESSLAHIEAMKYHLEDMRELVWKFINPSVEIPERGPTTGELIEEYENRKKTNPIA